MAENWLADAIKEERKLQSRITWPKLLVAAVSLGVVFGIAIIVRIHPVTQVASAASLSGTAASALAAGGASATPSSSPDTLSPSALSQEEAQEEAQINADKKDASLDSAQAAQEVADADALEKDGIDVALPTPITAWTPVPTPSPYDPPTPKPCAYESQIATASQNLVGAEGKLNGDTQQFNTPGGVGSYGLSAAALKAYETQTLQTDRNNVISAQNTLSYDKSQPGCSLYD